MSCVFLNNLTDATQAQKHCNSRWRHPKQNKPLLGSVCGRNNRTCDEGKNPEGI